MNGCKIIEQFKQFVQNQASSNSVRNSVNGVELRNACVTLSNLETYPVTNDEWPAEVLMVIWTKLQSKRCPKPFQLALLRAAMEEIENERLKAKQCDLMNNQRNGESLIETEQQQQHQQFELVELQKFVVNNLEKLFTRLNDNVCLDSLKNYADCNSICDGTNCMCDKQSPVLPMHVASSIKNKLRKMEDRHVCLDQFSELYGLKEVIYHFYAVFDGHSGAQAASFASSQLPYILAKILKTTKPNSVDMYREVLEAAFLETDHRFCEKAIPSGTTAVCALITSDETTRQLYVAWVGDSKALLVAKNANLQLVKPHTPSIPEERTRIESQPSDMNDDIAPRRGLVMFIQGQWRVNGLLNVSRSIGDYSIPSVIAEPDFIGVELTSNLYDFLILATDGLWDYVNENDIVEIVYMALIDQTKKIEDIPKELIDTAKQSGSSDNITVLIIFFKDRTSIIESYRSL